MPKILWIYDNHIKPDDRIKQIIGDRTLVRQF